MKPISRSKQDARPKHNGAKAAALKTTVIKKRFLVFNSCLSGDPQKMVAILRIWNPTLNSDVFYKLTPNCHKASFKVKSWKGRVRKNSYTDINIGVKIADLQLISSEEDAHVLTLTQLCQMDFLLEMTEYTSRWPRMNNANNCNLVVKVELHCITHEVLTKLQSEAKFNIEDPAITSEHIRRLVAKCAEEQLICSAYERNAYLTQEKNAQSKPLQNRFEKAQVAQVVLESHEPPLEQVKAAERTENVQVAPTSSTTDHVDKQGIVPFFFILLMLLLDIVLQIFSTTMGYSKHLLRKLSRRFLLKKASVQSEQVPD